MKININKDTAKNVAYFTGNIASSFAVGAVVGLAAAAQTNPVGKSVCTVGGVVIGMMVGEQAGEYAANYVDGLLDTIDDFQHRSEKKEAI